MTKRDPIVLRLPRLTRLTKILVGVLFIAHVGTMIAANFLGQPQLLRFFYLTSPDVGLDTLYQLLLYPLAPPASAIAMLVQLLFFVWIVAPVEHLFGEKRVLQLLALGTFLSGVVGVGAGFLMPGVVIGLGPALNAALAAYAWAVRFRGDINLFGAVALKPVHLIGLMAAIDVLNFVWAPNLPLLAAELAGIGVGMGFIEWLSQPPKRKKKPAARKGGPQLSVVPGGPNDGPSWLN